MKRGMTPFGPRSPRTTRVPRRLETLTAMQQRPYGSGRRATLTIAVDIELMEWLQDRAALLGTTYTKLSRDVLAMWANLLRESEREEGVSWDDAKHELPMPERHPGYTRKLIPVAAKASHLDSSPLGMEEL